MKTILLKGGFVVTPQTVLRTDVVLRNGIIELTDARSQVDETVDITGKYVVPGFVDVHFHGYELFDFTAGLYDARTGDLVWTADAGEVFSGSPLLVGTTVYLPDRTGKALVFELGDRFELAASSDLGDQITASPVLAGGRLYFRTRRSLFCVGRK